MLLQWLLCCCRCLHKTVEIVAAAAAARTNFNAQTHTLILTYIYTHAYLYVCINIHAYIGKYLYAMLVCCYACMNAALAST